MPYTMNPFKYLFDAKSVSRYQLLGDEKVNPTAPLSETRITSGIPKKGFIGLTIVLLVLSNSFTWFLAYEFIGVSKVCNTNPRTRYAALERDKPMAWGERNIYTDHNETLRNAAWDAISIDDGIVALPDDFVAEKGLPVAQRFPWDDTKGIYLVNGHHNLHCVRAIYISLMEFWQGKPQSRLWGHVIHCVDSLRQEVICNADDTPRYSTSDDTPESGAGQYRMCRNWDALQEWAKQYNACYRYVNQTETIAELPNIERYIYCPEGSPYITQVEHFFGHVEW